MKSTPEELFAGRAAETFAGLSMVDGLGKLSPRLAYSGIKAMVAHPEYARVHLPELGVLPDTNGVLSEMYDEARVNLAVSEASRAGAGARTSRASERSALWARRLGVSPQEASDILGSRSEERTAVEARTRLYR